eukprot:1695687-Prymnesium_polylepis.1
MPPLDRAANVEARRGALVQLANCTSSSSRLAPWQEWQIMTEQHESAARGRGTCSGSCGPQLLRLRAVPSLCLTMGLTRTPRPPYQIQAQLGSCNASASAQVGHRSRLHVSPKSGTVKTSHRVQAHRKHSAAAMPLCLFERSCAHTTLA